MSAAAEVASVRETALSVEGMNCASCVAHVEGAIRGVAGVSTVQVNLARGRAVVTFDVGRASEGDLARAVTESGYPAEVESAAGAAGETDRVARQAKEASAWLRRFVVAGVLWLPVEAWHWIGTWFGGHGTAHADGGSGGGVGTMVWVSAVTSTLAIVLVGGAFYRSAWGALRRGTSNMDTLIAMGATVAWGYSAVALAGFILGWWGALPHLYFMEAAGLLALISLGHYLEAAARRSAGSAIRQLLQLAPATAIRVPAPQSIAPPPETKRRVSLSVSGGTGLAAPVPATGGTGGPEEVSVASLVVGDFVLVRPGARVPTDCEVVEGTSGVDESMLTGESMPVTRGVGDRLIGGTLNSDGALTARVTRTGRDTALAQIVRLVEKAQSDKPPVQKLADQIAAWFVPTVLGIAALTGVGWYAWGSWHGWEAARTWAALANAVCSVLIIACPCALGLAIPAALMVGMGRGAQRGILIRDISALQASEKIRTVAFDKTGTLTHGKPVVDRIVAAEGFSAEEVLRLAASVEQYSEHPLAKAVVRHAQSQAGGAGLRPASEFQNFPGRGVRAVVDGRTLLVGGESFVGGEAVMGGLATGDGTRICVAEQTGTGADAAVRALGMLMLSDSVRAEAAAVVRRLSEMGVRSAMITGDRQGVAERVAAAVGISVILADVLPEQKADVIRELRREGAVAMVGDGVNDAPALALADLGIALGSGSDVAKEAGSIVLVSGQLQGVAAALVLSRVTMRVIRQNLFFAFAYNVLAIPLAALGLLSPVVAALAMALSDITVIGNALRLKRAKID